MQKSLSGSGKEVEAGVRVVAEEEGQEGAGVGILVEVGIPAEAWILAVEETALMVKVEEVVVQKVEEVVVQKVEGVVVVLEGEAEGSLSQIQETLHSEL